MLVTSVVGNIHDDPVDEGTHVEHVTLDGDGLMKRIQRVVTDHGRELGIRLPPGSPDLRDGDILARSADSTVVVRVEPTDVLVIAARSIREMAVVAHSLGNRHVQAQFFGTDSEYAADVMVVPYDHTVVAYLQSVGVPFERQARLLAVPFRHGGHTH
jgi:urease accessory protein